MRYTRGSEPSFQTFGSFTPRRERPDAARESNKEGVKETPPSTDGSTLHSDEASVRLPDASMGPFTNSSAARQVQCGEDLLGGLPYSICTGCQRVGCIEVFYSQEAYWDHLRRYASPEQQRAAAELDRYFEGYASEGEIQECDNPCWYPSDYID